MRTFSVPASQKIKKTFLPAVFAPLLFHATEFLKKNMKHNNKRNLKNEEKSEEKLIVEIFGFSVSP